MFWHLIRLPFKFSNFNTLMGLFTDQTEHAPDDADVETPEKFAKPDNRSKGPGDNSVDPVGEESVLIEEEKAQKGVVKFT